LFLHRFLKFEKYAIHTEVAQSQESIAKAEIPYKILKSGTQIAAILPSILQIVVLA